MRTNILHLWRQSKSKRRFLARQIPWWNQIVVIQAETRMKERHPPPRPVKTRQINLLKMSLILISMNVIKSCALLWKIKSPIPILLAKRLQNLTIMPKCFNPWQISRPRKRLSSKNMTTTTLSSQLLNFIVTMTLITLKWSRIWWLRASGCLRRTSAITLGHTTTRYATRRWL